MHNQDHDFFPYDDARMEIMSHLPLKSLFRFRIINKSYREIIDSSQFRKLHVENQLCNNLNKEEDSVLLQFVHHSGIFRKMSSMRLDTGKSQPQYQDFLKNNAVTRFSGPLHGLICLYSENSTDSIALCNPFLQEIKILPPSPSPLPPSLNFYRRTVGLGYDDLKKDFKIVQLLHDPSLDTNIVEVYSRKENKWRVLADNPLHKYFFVAKPIHRVEPVSRRSAAVAQWKGSASWKKTGGGRIFLNAIVSFDMRSESMEVIKIPFLGYLRILKIFANNQASFTMLTASSVVYPRKGLSIWVYKREWVKVANLGPFSDFGWAWPLTTWKTNGLILKIYGENWKFALYDICSRQIMECFEFPVANGNSVKMVEYRGSFISP